MSARWSPFTKGVVVVALLLLAAWLLNRFNALLAPLVTALLVAYLLSLPVGILTRRTGMSRTWATVLVFLVAILLLALLPALAGPRLVALISTLQIDFESLQKGLDEFAAHPIVVFNLQIDPQSVLDQVMAAVGGLMSPVASGAFTFVAGAAEVLAWALFAFVVAFLLVKDLHYFTRVIGERVPTVLAADFYRLGQELGAIWNAYFRGQLIASTAVGIMTSIAVWALGLPSALALGVLAGVLNFIPNIGPILAAIPAVLLALIRGSSWLPFNSLVMGLLVVAAFVIISQVENLYLRPIVIGRRVQLHPVVVIVGTVAGALVAGILGVLLAAPVIASARVLLGYVYRKLLDQEPFEQPVESPQALGVAWRGLIRGRPISVVLFDLDGTLVETDDRAVESLAQRLVRIQRFLPDRDPARAARRLIMWSNDLLNRWLAVLDRFGLDEPAQQLARRLGLVTDNTAGHELEPVHDTLTLLQDLQTRYRLGIVSTRREEEIRVYLDQYGLNGTVQVIAGSDTTERLKPHPQPVLWASQQLAVEPSQVAMVGDTAADVQAAKAAGALAIGVLCGFGERRDLAQADLILDSTADLAEWL